MKFWLQIIRFVLLVFPFLLLEQTVLFCPLRYISNSIATAFILFHRLSDCFTLCLDSLHSISNHGAPCFFPLRITNVVFIGSAAVNKLDTKVSSALFGSRAIYLVASTGVSLNSLVVTFLWNVCINLPCQTNFVNTVAS